jgi:hypothetical protein
MSSKTIENLHKKDGSFDTRHDQFREKISPLFSPESAYRNTLGGPKRADTFFPHFVFGNIILISNFIPICYGLINL